MLQEMMLSKKKKVGDPDPFWSTVQLLLPGDGANNSTVITDVSNFKRVGTTLGDVHISTNRSKWGGSSIYCAGNAGDELRYAFDAAWDIAWGGGFTAEGWFNIHNATPLQQQIPWGWDPTPDGTTQFPLMYLWKDDSTIVGRALTNSGTVIGPVAHNMVINTWYHIAYVRSGTTMYIFINGVLKASGAMALTSQQRLMRLFKGTSCYVNDLRLSKMARYTAAFTPPTKALPTWG